MGLHLLLVRHGQTVWNREGILQGQKDVPLSEEGEHQARLLAPFFKDWEPDVVCASPLVRARRTAEILTEGLSLELLMMPALMERASGVLEGMGTEERIALYPDVVDALQDDPVDTEIPGGESYRAFWSRVTEALGDIPESAERAALVIHGGAIRVLISHFLGQGPEHPVRIQLDNAHISLVEVKGGESFVRAVNVWPVSA